MARRISAFLSITLDGVVQGIGRADEDTRGGFGHGGWAHAYSDEVMQREAGKGMAKSGDMLFGHRTWQDFHGVWAGQTDGNPFTTHMNAVRKYVVSRTADSVGAWQNSVLLRGEAVDTVGALRADGGPDLSIVGSVALVQSMHAAGLLDHLTLLIHPLTLGTGTRLFTEAAPLTRWTLTGSVPTTTGVIIADYDRV